MGVQHEAGAACLYVGRGVQSIAPNGVADGLQMHPQLMGAAGQGLQLQQ